jgi:hypothetical protein
MASNIERDIKMVDVVGVASAELHVIVKSVENEVKAIEGSLETDAEAIKTDVVDEAQAIEADLGLAEPIHTPVIEFVPPPQPAA